MNEYALEGKWIADLNNELEGSDRACVILASAVLDERLKSLIEKYLLPSSGKNDKLLGRSGVLESFSSRIELARRLNLISEEKRKSLDWLRDIRNEAAHRQEFTLEEDSYKDRINNIVAELQMKKNASALLKPPYIGVKGKFIAAVIILAMSLELEIKETKQTEHVPYNVLSKYEFKENDG